MDGPISKTDKDRQCRFMARNRPAGRAKECLFIGVDRKRPANRENGAFDAEPPFEAAIQLPIAMIA